MNSQPDLTSAPRGCLAEDCGSSLWTRSWLPDSYATPVSAPEGASLWGRSPPASSAFLSRAVTLGASFSFLASRSASEALRLCIFWPCRVLGFVLTLRSIGGCSFRFVPTLKTWPLVPRQIGTLAHSVLSRSFASGRWLQDPGRMAPAADVDGLGLIPMPSPNCLHLLLPRRREVPSPPEVFVGWTPTAVFQADGKSKPR